jgi:hypothetical protein
MKRGHWIVGVVVLPAKQAAQGCRDFTIGFGPLLPGPARTPGPVQPKKLGRWKKIKKLGRKPAPPPNDWANFCQLLLKLGCNYEICNWATF